MGFFLKGYQAVYKEVGPRLTWKKASMVRGRTTENKSPNNW